VSEPVGPASLSLNAVVKVVVEHISACNRSVFPLIM